MQTAILWAARIALALVVVTAWARVSDPQRSVEAFVIAPDAVQHALFAYGLTTLAALAFPRIPSLACGLAVIIAGAAIEGFQLHSLIPGGAEWKDWIADIVGAAAALMPMLAASARTRLRNADPGVNENSEAA